MCYTVCLQENNIDTRNFIFLFKKKLVNFSTNSDKKSLVKLVYKGIESLPQTLIF